METHDRGRLRPVCAGCNRPADLGSCPTCRGYRPDPPEGGGPTALLLAVGAVLLTLWIALLLAR